MIITLHRQSPLHLFMFIYMYIYALYVSLYYYKENYTNVAYRYILDFDTSSVYLYVFIVGLLPTGHIHSNK